MKKPTKRVALMFPGQAAQSPGMGQDLYDNSRVARETIEEVNGYLGRNLTNVMFKGSAVELTATENAQPAIAAVSIAIWKAIEDSNQLKNMPAMVAGHSLGEYSSLFMTRALSLEDTMRLIARRSELMQRACEMNPGGMIALIGIDAQAIEDVCRAANVYISNINAPSQIIISGKKDALARAVDLARVRGAKRAVPLGVNGAFHSKLMASAQQELNEFIDSLKFKDPEIPIIGNVNALPITNAQMIKDELKIQLQSCVRWSDSVKYMTDNHIDTFIEVGPGNILSNLARRMVGDRAIISINDYQSLQDYLVSL